MERKHVVFLTVLSVATLLVAVVGATFAFFSTTVNKDAFQGDGASNANSASVSTAKLTSGSTIIFRAKAGIEGNKIDMSNAVPGDYDEAVFEIENTGDIDINYNVAWKSVTSNFADTTIDGQAVEAHPEELVYKLTCTGGTTYSGSETQAPTTSAGGNMNTTALTVAAKQTAVCTVRVDFKEINDVQNYNQGRSFAGTIDVSTENITSN